MTFDIGQFVQIFLEEAAEHLAALESGLLAIDLQAPEAETLNAIFRAAHSIKGGAGTFGFGEMGEFTHTLETLLDRVRKGELALDEKRVDVCLRAVDLLRSMVEAHRRGDTPAMDAARALSVEIVALTCDSQPPAQALPSAMDAAARPVRQAYEICLNLPDTHRVDAGTLDNLIHTLGQLGELTIYTRPSETAGAGQWRMHLDTDVSQLELTDFISYVLDPAWVDIAAQVSPQALSSGLPLTQEFDGFGFFSPVAEPTASTDEAYGFFEPLPETTTPAQVESVDPGYGFFDVLPEAVSAPAASATSAGDDPGYGFFEPLPPDAATVEPEPVTVATLAAPTPAEAPPAAAKAEKSPPAAADANSIRVGIGKVDQLINLVGELVITQSMLLQSATTLDPVTHERLLGGLAQLERNSRDLQEAVMSIRMVPMSFVFSRYPRIVRDLTRKLGKQADIHLIGESTELDKGLVEKIVDPLTHLVRNAVDHGLESPAERSAAGKPAAGQITLSASHQSGQILIEISDDGAGLNRERILAKAARQGIAISPDAPDGEVWDLIFAPGFSTAETVTDVSGRGVGMDVVRKNIQALGGSVLLSSAAGRGTRVSIRLPLTLAILDGMSVRAGDETFIVPLGFVIESLHASALEFRSIGRNGKVVKVRDDYIPVVSLAALFDIPGASRQVDDAVLVVVESENATMAIAVDALLGQHQVVVKNLETNFRRVAGISGATILGDGQVSLILDIAGLLRMARPELASLSA